MSLDKYFDKTYCINLRRRPDRWARVSKRFEELGFDNIERYEAIDGKLANFSQVKHDGDLLPGELGIMETHFNLIREAKEKNYESILVMEDDVVFTKGIKELETFIKATPENWDLLYFGGSHQGNLVTEVNDKIIKLSHTVCLHCVAIKNTMYDKILEISKDREKPIDIYYAELQSINNAYCFNPSIATQDMDFSDIQDKIVDYTYDITTNINKMKK